MSFFSSVVVRSLRRAFRAFRASFIAASLLLLAAGCGGDDPAESVDQASGSVYGVWELVSLNGETPLSNGVRPPSLLLDLAPALDSEGQAAGASRLEGFSGCNGYSGSFVLEGTDFRAMSLSSDAASCGPDLDDQGARLYRLLASASVDASDGVLTLSGANGRSARFERTESDVGLGVYRLESVDGEPVDSRASVKVVEGAFTAWAGCWLRGTLDQQGQGLVFQASSSLESGTTTVPEGQTDGSVPPSPAVGPFFGCEDADRVEARVLAALDGGTGVVEDGRLTISAADGGQIVFRLA